MGRVQDRVGDVRHARLVSVDEQGSGRKLGRGLGLLILLQLGHERNLTRTVNLEDQRNASVTCGQD